MLKLQGTPCPNCGRKGLHHPDHPHAQGWKEYGKAECRFCHKRFKLKQPQPATTTGEGNR